MVLDSTELTKSLSNTREWCASLIDTTNPKNCFRTALIEQYLSKSQGSDFDRMSFWPTPEEIDQIIKIKNEVLDSTSKKSTALNSGRLLLSMPEQSNFNGLSRQESNNYLDDNDNPPWDTWLGQVKLNELEFLLFSWVPEEFVESVELGIQVECIGMLYWANSKYWGEYTTPNKEFLNSVPKWVFEHESAKT